MKRIRLFCSDIDGTLAGDREAEARFHDAWLDLDPGNRPLLVLNSGRLIEDQRRFIATTGLPWPDIYIGGVGTMLSHETDPAYAALYHRSMGTGFDTGHIAAVLSELPDIHRQPDEFQHDRKSSWYLHDADGTALSAVEQRLAEAGLEVRIVYSSGRDLDILPSGADKGAALSWLCKQLGIPLDEVVVAGDTNNDRSMFELPGVRGIVVNNALPELLGVAIGHPNIYSALKPMADGVLEGLEHWGVFRKIG
ncbi:HAD-IIB family hydrolase [Pararhizobium sp.]|uniref:HAD-IIB family hydrolase n=1 Tax=Pararhizobium sp. TaxID=1977563 RepID=UPI00271DAD91|nr:HAD-IIB family hydrolase [Pararhizobium sp.]MDO9418899.1 HAD-IIB family hydrolase [Pararhizobium sp.]